MMVEVNRQLECARQATTHAKTPGEMRGVPMAGIGIGREDATVDVTTVGVGVGNIMRKIGRRKGIMIERDMRRLSSRNRGKT
jgi:hypothetical protein